MVNTLPDETYVLARLSALPEIYAGVLRAKSLLAAGEAKSAAEAARKCGISRGAFYKYKDSVFEYHSPAPLRSAAVRCVLRDAAGTLSGLVAALSGAGANILTISQGLPAGGTAPVSVSFRCPPGEFSLEGMLRDIRALPGVQGAELTEGN